MSKTPTTNLKHIEELCDAVVIARQDPNGDDEKALTDLRIHVLVHGIDDEHLLDSDLPPEIIEDSELAKGNPDYVPTRRREMTIRGKVWKLLLGIDHVQADVYIELLSRGKSAQYAKIRRDSFRTFPLEKSFQRVVPEQRIIRVLNCFVHEYGEIFGYVQGMNAILAPFLYTMPELDAFFAFCKFVTKCFPLYWICYVSGAQAGCLLVDQCLRSADIELFNHLTKLGLHCEIYGFHSVQSLSASVPPFSQLVRLWDILMAFGPHLNVLSVVGQIHSKRVELMACTTGFECQNILNSRHASPLDAAKIIAMTMTIQPHLMLDSKLYAQILRHSFDPRHTSEILGDKGRVVFEPVDLPCARAEKEHKDFVK
uniref:Bub2 protein n=1 Tax=Hirondellea gigas TaxID=1518452 RepID=A0A6A7GBU2_9CRUS